ncbi:MAG: LamG domain-containing protein [Kiritimatiellaeota bacterium]|nr:LamG domain-containing protein [Kiritimatiellota bacterium]
MKRDRLSFPSTRLALGLCLACTAGFRASAADSPQGLVLHYSFEQAPAANGMVADKSNLHNDGRVTGAKWTAAGKLGGAMEFAAANDFITVPNHSSLNSKKLTLTIWFKTSKSDAVNRRILDKRATRGYALGIAGEAKNPMARGRLAFTINGRYVCLSDNVVTDGAWHHGAAVFDGKEMSLVVDGIPQKSALSCTEDVAANLDDLTIGMNRTNPDDQEKNHSFDGALDELMVFNRALLPEEIRSLISTVDPTLGKPKFTKFQVAGRLRQLKLLHEEGLLTDKFYNEKVAECEATAETLQSAAPNAPAATTPPPPPPAKAPGKKGKSAKAAQ